MISTRQLDGLPDNAGLLRLTKSLAMLDAIVSPEWEFRYYSFNSRWAAGEQMASMRDGSGDQWYALFTARWVALHGLAHESPMYRADDPWPGIWESLPPELAGFRDEPAFDTQNSTFCIWRLAGQPWRRGDVSFPPGDDPDGSAGLLALLDGRPESYQRWAESHYERALPLGPIEAIYAHNRLDEALVHALNPDLALGELDEEVAEIGYPLGARSSLE
jgi:hypothetical protein